MKNTDVKNYGFKRASEIHVPPEFFNPIKTGIKDVDEAWSELGGIVPSQVTFITGPPGSGKTTLCLKIGAALSEEVSLEEYLAAGIDVAFISLEMSEFQLAHQAKKIPGFANVHVTGEFDQVETMNMIRKLKPGLIILDSIQKAARKMKLDDGRTMPFNTAQYVITDMFTKYAKESWCPVMLIGHCDKSGNYKGPSDLLHDVDSHLNVLYDKEMDMRTFSFGKNRFGGIVQESLFGITAENVWIGNEYYKTVFGDDAIITRKEAQKAGPVSPEDIAVCLYTLEEKWNGSAAKASISTIFNYLKQNSEDFNENSIIGDVNKVHLDFRGNGLGHCHFNSGELVFGKKMFNETLELGRVGYKKEQKYINARVNTKAQLMVWCIIHEWQHLYKESQQHNEEFFQAVAKRYDWFMESVQPAIAATV